MSFSDPSAPITQKGTNAAQMHPNLYRQAILASPKCHSPVRQMFFIGGSCRLSISRLGSLLWFFDAFLALVHGLTGKLRHLHFALVLTHQHNVPSLLSFYTQYINKKKIKCCANICSGQNPSCTRDFLVQEYDRDDKVAIFLSNKFISTLQSHRTSHDSPYKEGLLLTYKCYTELIGHAAKIQISRVNT